MTTYTFEPALIATLTETIVTFALSEGYVAEALADVGHTMPYAPYELAGGDLEYLRGEHDDSPAEVAALSPDAYDDLCAVVQAEVAERLEAAVTRHALALATADEPGADVEPACRWLAAHDNDALRGEVYELALARMTALVEQETASLADGEALCWHADAHRERDMLGADGEVTGTYTADLESSDYLIARTVDGDLVWGRRDNGGERDASDVIDWWAQGEGMADAIAAALTATETCLTVLSIAGSETKVRREGRHAAICSGWDEVVEAEGAEHLAGGGGIILDPRDADALADDDAAREAGRRMARAHLETVRR